MLWNDIDCVSTIPRAVICNMPSDSCKSKNKWIDSYDNWDHTVIGDCDMNFNASLSSYTRLDYIGYNDGYGLGWRRMTIEMNAAFSLDFGTYSDPESGAMFWMYDYNDPASIVHEFHVGIWYVNGTTVLYIYYHPYDSSTSILQIHKSNLLDDFQWDSKIAYPFRIEISDNGTITAEFVGSVAKMDIYFWRNDFPSSYWISNFALQEFGVSVHMKSFYVHGERQTKYTTIPTPYPTPAPIPTFAPSSVTIFEYLMARRKIKNMINICFSILDFRSGADAIICV